VKIYLKLFFLLTPFILSCKAKKVIPRRSSTRCHLDYKSSRTLTSLLKSNQAEFSTFSGKLNVKAVVDDKQTDFTVALRMKKDSIIWASISSFGIEGIRFIATKDTMKFINRVSNQFFVGDYDTLSKMINTEVDLEVLQALLIGNSVEFYEEDEKLRPGIDSCKYILGTIRKRKLRRMIRKGKELKEPAQNIWLRDSTFKISRILFREFESNREFDARFDNFKFAELPEGQTKKVYMPFELTYFIKSDKNFTINLEYTKASANKPQAFPFTIPEGYERIGKK